MYSLIYGQILNFLIAEACHCGWSDMWLLHKELRLVSSWRSGFAGWKDHIGKTIECVISAC